MSAKTFLSVLLFLSVFSHFGLASATTFYVDASVTAPGDGTSWETAFKTIQQGIDAASDGDTVTVAQGTYIGNIRLMGKNIVLASTNPLGPDIVANTIVDGSESGSVVTFEGTEDESCVLSGFTIQNGSAEYGGGVRGNRGHGSDHTHATISNNTITGNLASVNGGGLYWCDGIIQSNAISGNKARQNGGGLCGCDGTIRNNTITENRVETYGRGGGLYSCNGLILDNIISENIVWEGRGAGLYSCDGVILNNTIRGNEAWWGDAGGGDAGGLGDCDGTIRNNTIVDNTATFCGGGLAWCHGTIQNNIIAGNWGLSGAGLSGCDGAIHNNAILANWGGEGGGLSECGGDIHSNTIADNFASEWGGGLYLCDGIIRNCIIWGNFAHIDPQISDCSGPAYSCIEGWTGDPEKMNTAQDPQFVDSEGPDNDPETYEDNDYRLAEPSPCIDAGLNQGWMQDATDMDGKPRILLGQSSMTVDMGAYEYGSFAFRVVDVANSVDSQTQLTWASRPGDTYTIWCCVDPSLGNWIEETTIPSQGEVTTWTDHAATCQYKLYRVELELVP